MSFQGNVNSIIGSVQGAAMLNKVNTISKDVKAGTSALADNAERMANLENKSLTRGDFEDYLANNSFDDFKRNMAIYNTNKQNMLKQKQKKELEARYESLQLQENMMMDSEDAYNQYVERGNR